MVKLWPEASAIIPRVSFGTVERALAVWNPERYWCQPTPNMRKDMDKKKRGDAHQADCVTQKPPYRGRLVFTSDNGVIGDQGCDTKNRCPCRGSRTHDNEADHIPAVTQPQIDLGGPAQYVGRQAITKGTSDGTKGVAKGCDRLSVNNPASESIGETHQQRIPRTYTQQQSDYQADGGIPGNESKAREKNNFGPIQQQVQAHERK